MSYKDEEYHKNYHIAHKEEHNLYCKEYYKKNKKSANKRSTQWRIDNPEYHWAYQTIYTHKKKGYVVNITPTKLRDIAINTKFCCICECELKYQKGKCSQNSATLDRKNNETILNIDNIMILCRRCNCMKQDLSISDMCDWCKNFINKFGE